MRISAALLAFWLALSLTAAASAANSQDFDKAEQSAPQATAEADMPKASEEASDEGIDSGTFLAGRFASDAGDRTNAVHYLEDMLQKDPGNVKVAMQLVAVYVGGGQIDKAVSLAKTLPEGKSRDMLDNLLLAIDAAHEGKFTEADQRLSEIYSTTSGAPWVPLLKGWLRVGAGGLTKPLTQEDILPEGSKAPAFLAYHLALVNDAAGLDEVAARQYALALSDPARTPFRAVEAAADFYRRHGQTEKLEQLRKQYLGAHPALSSLMDSEDTEAFDRLLAEGSGDQTGEEAEALVATPQEGIAEVLFTMASVLYSVDAGADAQLYLRLALYLRPDFPLAQMMLASLLEGNGDYAGANEIYASISPDSLFYERALLRRAYTLERQDKPEEAMAVLDARLHEAPDDAQAYIAKGDLLRMRGQLREAVALYTDAIGHIQTPESKDWVVFFARGACLDQLGEWQTAEVDLRHALKLSPNQPEVLNYLGYSLLVRNAELDHAKEMIERAYTLQPDAPEIVDSLGWALYKTGDIEGAVKYLEQAVEALPGDAAVNDHLGDAYWQAGRKTEARYQWQRALSSQPDETLEKTLQRKLQKGLPDKGAVKESAKNAG